ncbi:hypothetical protein [Larkinella terrae]|uniref:Uncharacterized protein n=1 Tax=Larkinella terrae TaxID=2025311 RepID=A0A7K0EIG0_9BACT|nr:hypothetical protein [Larkinella terrae]MRS61629.1 hypothetical protein [Larkinella terrae]
MKTKKVAGVEVPADLDMNGFESGKHAEPNYSFRLNLIEDARDKINLYFEKTSAFNRKTNSYGLKHRIEGAIGHHLANGELIVAMIGEGYRFERMGINCRFNVSSRSVKELL